ncbi:MAG: acetyl-CoA carboxylase biotin carboxyl carrier protein subunit [Chloroflexi bacterium]|nr:acetyl-CoA carboxylase biotin carboxyl carrier protein subunit [Chloroflexota bacterium]
MKYQVKVENQTFEVEIEDINARPVVARVDGQTFEIQPENGTQPTVQKEAARPAVAALPVGSASQHMNGNDLVAPLPGTVTEVFVKPGEKIEMGHVVLIIEAMKMKNSIRTVRSGVVGEVLVSAGQSVAHKQALIRFAEAGEAAWI